MCPDVTWFPAISISKQKLWSEMEVWTVQVFMYFQLTCPILCGEPAVCSRSMQQRRPASLREAQQFRMRFETH